MEYGNLFIAPLLHSIKTYNVCARFRPSVCVCVSIRTSICTEVQSFSLPISNSKQTFLIFYSLFFVFWFVWPVFLFCFFFFIAPFVIYIILRMAYSTTHLEASSSQCDSNNKTTTSIRACIEESIVDFQKTCQGKK